MQESTEVGHLFFTTITTTDSFELVLQVIGLSFISDPVESFQSQNWFDDRKEGDTVHLDEVWWAERRITSDLTKTKKVRNYSNQRNQFPKRVRKLSVEERLTHLRILRTTRIGTDNFVDDLPELLEHVVVSFSSSSSEFDLDLVREEFGKFDERFSARVRHVLRSVTRRRVHQLRMRDEI